ncbi:PQQ-binding-like beta-propeller repeat protein [Halomicroarcula sp. GCM10025817]|uniref:outer membrane protein assembly factor BamB family protein n=1 Tax=Haloarcula TaxID=2237 RepID=UPI0023E82F81|nr:PQQ-binding-like beta-propeller repeat protein [Halomicroarcula sp. SYNS111]
MRLRTVVVALAVVAALTGAVAVGFVGSGGGLDQQWVSDTARENEVNHHAVGVGPHDEVVVAPVAAVPNAEPIGPHSCSLVRLDPRDGTALWNWSVPAEDCFTHALTQPAVVDVDDDGDLEVAVSTTQHALVVLDADTGVEEWRVPLDTYGYGQPAVGDVTGGPGLELATSDIGGTVVLARSDGTTAWRAETDMPVWARPWLTDVDGDGNREVLVGGGDGVVAFAGDGTVLWNVSVPATEVTVADTAGGTTVLAGDDQTLSALGGATGDQRWNRTVSGTPRIHATGDADDDGDTEVYAGVGDNTVVAVDVTSGRVEWETPLGGGERQSMFAPVLGDVDGDGTRDVVAVTNDGTVAVLDGATGEERAAYERDVRIWTFASTADLDGDGDDEILVRYGDGRVVVLDWTTGGGSVLQTVG